MLLPSGRAFAWMAAGAGLAFVGSASSSIAAPFGLALVGATLLAFLADAVALRRTPPPQLFARFPTRLAHSEAASLRVGLRGAATRRLRATVDLPGALHGPRDETRVAPRDGERAELAFTLLARERGRHSLGPLHLRRLGRLGLAWVDVHLTLDLTVEVVPQLSALRERRLPHQAARDAGIHRARFTGASGSFESLREYTRGDDPRCIDWKASARHRGLVVREYEVERDRDVVLCIDCGRAMAERVGDRQRLDHALSAALGLAEVARAWRDRIGVLAFSDETQAELPAGRHSTGRLASLFADVHARPVEPDYPRALTSLARSLKRRSLVVLFSDVVDEEVSEPLAAYAAELARRHLPVLVALRDPELERAAGAAVTTPAQAYARAAATELEAARASTLEGLRRRGVIVVDVAPQTAIAAAIDAYVDIKRRGRL